MKKYKQDFLITYRDVNISGGLTNNALVDYMQEVAGNHAKELGINYSALRDEYYWIITRTKIHLDKVPRLGESIRLETYIAGLDVIYSVRRFDIYNEENELIGYILGYYLLMNKENHRPVKLKNFKIEEGIWGGEYTGETLKKLNSDLKSSVLAMNRKVFSSDIDSNNHMNNAHYIRWVMDMFSTEELSKQRVKTLQIQYVKETYEGNEIEVIRGITEQELTYIIGRDAEKTIHFIAEARIESLCND